MWRGCGGEYTIRLGSDSSCTRGLSGAVPLLRTDVGTLTRVWAGVLSAQALATLGNFHAPPELLDRLDDVYRLLRPSPDWDY